MVLQPLDKDFMPVYIFKSFQEGIMFDLTLGKFCIETGSGNECDVTLSGAWRI